jgi:hypothetical protein
MKTRFFTALISYQKIIDSNGKGEKKGRVVEVKIEKIEIKRYHSK